MARFFRRSARLVLGDAASGGLDVSSLRVQFEVTQDQFGVANLARFRVFNVNLSRVAVLDRFVNVQLDAGYAGTTGRIFLGQILNVFDRRDGPDSFVEIFAMSGARNWSHAVTSLAFAAGTSARRVVSDVAKSFSGLTLDGADLVPDDPILSSAALMGPTREIMDQLARTYGFEWSIHGDRIVLRQRGRSDGRTPVVIDSGSGMIGSPVATDLGIEVRTLMNPNVYPGRSIAVRSLARAGAFSGQQVVRVDSTRAAAIRRESFVTHKVIHTGDTRGADWFSLVHGVRPGVL